MAKPNYRQQKKQKEQARLSRQAEKLKRRIDKPAEPQPGDVDASVTTLPSPPVDQS